MTAPAKIAAYLGMLAVVFTAALWVGTTFGPNPDVVVTHPATSGHQDRHGGYGR